MTVLPLAFFLWTVPQVAAFLHKGHRSFQPALSLWLLSSRFPWLPPSAVQAQEPRAVWAPSVAHPCVLTVPCKFPLTFTFVNSPALTSFIDPIQARHLLPAGISGSHIL